MTLRRLSRVAFAAWLGLFALAIQTVIPSLVAVEAGLAADGDSQSAFALCLFGQPQDRNGDASDHHQVGFATCPICVALHASPAFAAPDIALLPLPSGREIDAVSLSTQSAPRLLTLAAYRSRAPPVG